MEQQALTETNKDVAAYDPSVLGASEEVTAEDINISKLVVMTDNSTLVKDDVARKGAIIDLETKEELGYMDEKPVEVVLLKSFKYWVETENDEFKARFPAVSPNELAWEEGDVKRTFHHAFYVLIPSHVEEGVELPYEVAFRSTDLAQAKKISKWLLTMSRQKRPSWDTSFVLTAEKKTKGKHSWYGFNVVPGSVTSDKVKESAYNWYLQVRNTVVPDAKPETQDQY